MFSRSRAWVIAGITIGCLGAGTAQAQVLPDFAAMDFDGSSADITNTYLPFSVGSSWEYEGVEIDLETGETETEQILVEVLHGTRIVAGVESRIVRDRVFLDGLLVEDTFDWFAQDTSGNVWYMGEDVTDYHYDDDGNLIGTSHPGQWETGVDGALPGYVMPVTQAVGDHFYQEFYPGEAEDHAEIIGIDETLDLPGFPTFHSVVMTLDQSLDPEDFEHKFYAPGIGLIAERGYDTESGMLTGSVDLVSTNIPEPTTVAVTLAGIGAMLCRPRGKRPV